MQRIVKHSKTLSVSVQLERIKRVIIGDEWNDVEACHERSLFGGPIRDRLSALWKENQKY